MHKKALAFIFVALLGAGLVVLRAGRERYVFMEDLASFAGDMYMTGLKGIEPVLDDAQMDIMEKLTGRRSESRIIAVEVSLIKSFSVSINRMMGKELIKIDDYLFSMAGYSAVYRVFSSLGLNNLRYILYSLPFLVISCLIMFFQVHLLARTYNRTIFVAARLSAMFIAVFVIISWIFIKKRYYFFPGSELFLWPVAVYFASAFLNKVYDPNFPLWNDTLKTTIFPMAVLILVAMEKFHLIGG